ncbi:MAG: ATP-binding protein [bacterium]
MSRQLHKFESRLHLGLLAIILVLLGLDVGANYVIHKSRQLLTAEITSDLQLACLMAARESRETGLSGLSAERRRHLKQTYHLSKLGFLPTWPADTEDADWTRWQASFSGGDNAHRAGIARAVAGMSAGDLTRGEGTGYFYVHLVRIGSGTGAVVAARESPALAFLDGLGRNIIRFSPYGVALIGLLYVLLVRFIQRPFRGIIQQAELAGQPIEGGGDVEAVVAHYRQIIDQLRGKETELIELNRIISDRVDSLQNYNQYLLSSVNSGVVTIDRGGKIRSANPAAEKIFGTSESDLLGQHFFELLQNSIDIVNAISRALDCHKGSPYFEVSLASPTGEERYLGVSVSVIADIHRQTIGASVLVNDLTDRTRLRKELESRNRLAALGEMAGGLAHQLRNSLGAIVGYATLITRKLRRQNMDASSAEALVQESKEAEALIKRFLHFARPFDYQPQPVDLAELVADLIKSLEVREDFKDISIQSDIRLDCPVTADSLLLKQALLNLIENAAKAYEGCPGVVMVSAVREKNQAVIRIKDQGCGIAPEDLEKVYTPFYSSRPSGSGLGLPLVAKIVELHEGHLDVRSELGQGTVFCLSLLVADEQEIVPTH